MAGKVPKERGNWPRFRWSPKGADFGPEQVGKGSVELLAPGVAIVSGIDPVRGGDRFEHLGVGWRGIVGKEAHENAR